MGPDSSLTLPRLPGVTLAGEELLRLEPQVKPARRAAAPYSFAGLDFSKNAGCTAFNLWVEGHSSGRFNLFGHPPWPEIQTAYEKGGTLGRANIVFQAGAAPLFPLANRLRDDNVNRPAPQEAHSDTPVRATILGQGVTAPRNWGSCHIHGLAYKKVPGTFFVRHLGGEAQAVATFDNLWLGEWTGRAQLTITHSLTPYTYSFAMRAVNAGVTPIPMGMGAHPYIGLPGARREAIRLHIPATHMVEINNYQDVWPTGKILKTPAQLDFSGVRGRPIENRYLDNLWVNLIKDADGLARAELFDDEAQVRVQLTAQTSNVIGIQAYCPEKSSIVALEFVTHLPDPRDELWGSTVTGMKLVPPGGEMTYGYKIEVSKI